jgi:hypothetical protein
VHLCDKYKGRENEPVTPAILKEISGEQRGQFWWVKIRGKCYSPDELSELCGKFPELKIMEIKQVDPRLELERANRILVRLHERRIQFEKRVKAYGEKYGFPNWNV